MKKIDDLGIVRLEVTLKEGCYFGTLRMKAIMRSPFSATKNQTFKPE
jgi:hypothetical protein